MEIREYKLPAGQGGAEIIEKRSRFIGHVMPVENEEEAKSEIARVKAKFHDARHNCWCYIIGSSMCGTGGDAEQSDAVYAGAERYSDDGEPQGTAGLPMLDVFRRGGIVDAVCVVTRYFGGVLLGPGGLSRAYSETARLALADAGISVRKLCECVEIVCPYNLLGRVKSELETGGGLTTGIEYGEAVIINAVFPDGTAEAFNKRICDISAGTVTGAVTGKQYI